MPAEPSKLHCSLSDPSSTYSITTQRSGLPHPGEYLRLCLLQWNRCAETKKYDPNERTHHNYRKKKLSNEEIANLSDVQFKTLVIRMVTELVEFGHKLEEKTKTMLRETKENIQGNNSDDKETGTQINGVDQKEERNTNQKRMKKQEFKKMRGLGTSRTS